MRILQVVPYYPPHVGGMEYCVGRLSRELAKRGHEVIVFTSSDKGESYHEEIDGVQVYRFKSSAKAYNVPIASSLLFRLLQETRPDIIHTHQYPVFFSDMAALTSLVRRIPLVLHIHVVSEPKSAFSSCVSSLYYKSVGQIPFMTACSIIAPSMAYKKKLLDMGVASGKVRIVPYGIDLDRFSLGDNGEDFRKRHNCQGSSLVLSVGRLNYQKGFQYLLKAFAGVLQQIPDVKLAIVGEGEDLRHLQSLARSLRIADSVIFTGVLSLGEMPGAYAAADVFVLPSVFESFGIVLIEAQAAGKPVIGTRVGGVPEVIQDGQTGFLISPRSNKQLIDSMIRLLSDKALACEMGENGKRYARSRFDIQNIVNRITTTYEEIATRCSY